MNILLAYETVNPPKNKNSLREATSLTVRCALPKKAPVHRYSRVDNHPHTGQFIHVHRTSVGPERGPQGGLPGVIWIGRLCKCDEVLAPIIRVGTEPNFGAYIHFDAEDRNDQLVCWKRPAEIEAVETEIGIEVVIVGEICSIRRVEISCVACYRGL